MTAAALPGAAPALPAGTPAPLACLVRYYGVRAEQAGGAFFGVLPDGRRLPYDDGRTKTHEERLEHPDLHDVFAQPYVRGPIRPVTTEDLEPGRVRVDALFQARYGDTEAHVDVVPLVLFGQRLRVHRLAADAFRRVEARLAPALASDPSLRRYFAGLGGTFVWRNIAGTDRRSAHSYGVSIDLNTKLSHYWRWQRPRAPLRWQNLIPQLVVDAFEAEGFVWGGRWYHYDTMHFEYRPELLDPACTATAGRQTEETAPVR